MTYSLTILACVLIRNTGNRDLNLIFQKPTNTVLLYFKLYWDDKVPPKPHMDQFKPNLGLAHFQNVTGHLSLFPSSSLYHIEKWLLQMWSLYMNPTPPPISLSFSLLHTQLTWFSSSCLALCQCTLKELSIWKIYPPTWCTEECKQTTSVFLPPFISVLLIQ